MAYRQVKTAKNPQQNMKLSAWADSLQPAGERFIFGASVVLD